MNMGNVFLCKRNLLLGSFIAFSVVACFAMYYLPFPSSSLAKTTSKVVVTKEEPLPVRMKVEKETDLQSLTSTQTPLYMVTKAELYRVENSLPFSVIKEMTTISYDVKEKVENLIENSDLYYLATKDGNTLAIVSNNGDEKFVRHDVKFVEFDADGNQKEYTFNICLDEDTRLDDWVFDKESNLPRKHTKYLKRGVVEYVETWNYSPDVPIKYELKNGENKLLSIKKEVVSEDGISIRTDYLNYDNDGNIETNISINYEGPNITKFTYYDARNKDNSATITSEYSEGLKTCEKVYSSDYKLNNTYIAEYYDGELESIDIFDKSDNKIEQILSE